MGGRKALEPLGMDPIVYCIPVHQMYQQIWEKQLFCMATKIPDRKHFVSIQNAMKLFPSAVQTSPQCENTFQHKKFICQSSNS